MTNKLETQDQAEQDAADQKITGKTVRSGQDLIGVNKEACHDADSVTLRTQRSWRYVKAVFPVPWSIS
jgi:hypothetical protein